MDPLTAGLGIMAISGLAQAFISAKARGAASEELRSIKDDYDRLVSQLPEYNLKITDPPELHRQMLQRPQFQRAMDLPQFNHNLLKPRELKQLERFVPQIAPYIKEQEAILIERNPAMDRARDAQLKALERFTKIGEGGFDPEYQEKVRKAGEATQREAQGREGLLTQSFARRGLGGSGLELAAKIANQGHLMNRLASANAQSAGDSYRNQLLALARGAELGNSLGNQEANIQRQNADIINNFNQRLAESHRQHLMNQQNVGNQGMLHNINLRQRLGEQNVQNLNERDMNERSRQDRIQQFLDQAKMQRIGRDDANAKWDYEAMRQGFLDKDAASKYIAQWHKDEKRNQNDLKSNVFRNKIGILSGRHGAQKDIINNDIGGAQDINQAISGLGKLGAQGAYHYFDDEE